MTGSIMNDDDEESVLEESEEESRDVVKEAENLKLLGNEVYRRKCFIKAMDYYNAAIEMDPTNMKFYSNMAAVYYEKRMYLECIDFWETATDIGQLNLAESVDR